MKQVILIGGGTTFDSHDEYINYLRTRPVSQESLVPQGSWKETLQNELGAEFLVLKPSMPNTANARYDEWALWFRRITEVVEDDCILVGHSLGGIFLVRYLSELPFPKRIRATLLLAAPFDDETDEALTDFKITTATDLFTKQAGKIVFFAGIDDPVVKYSELEKYRQVLPNAEYHTVPAPDHFVRESFPELVEQIKKI